MQIKNSTFTVCQIKVTPNKKKCHNIKTERFERHHQLQTVLWCDHTVSSDGCSSTLRKTSQSVREQQQKQPLYEGNVARWYLFSTTATCRKVCLALWLFIDHHCWTAEFWWVGPGPSATRLSYTTIKNHVCFLDSCVSSALTKTPGNIKSASASLLATKHTDSCHTWWSGISW